MHLISNPGFLIVKTVVWDERISNESNLYGSGIISRYINITDEETHETDSKKIKMRKKKKKKEKRKIEGIESSEIRKKKTMTCDEIISLEIEEPYSFFIKNNSSINSHLETEKNDDQDMLDYFDDNLKS